MAVAVTNDTSERIILEAGKKAKVVVMKYQMENAVKQ